MEFPRAEFGLGAGSERAARPPVEFLNTHKRAAQENHPRKQSPRSTAVNHRHGRFLSVSLSVSRFFEIAIEKIKKH